MKLGEKIAYPKDSKIRICFRTKKNKNVYIVDARSIGKGEKEKHTLKEAKECARHLYWKTTNEGSTFDMLETLLEQKMMAMEDVFEYIRSKPDGGSRTFKVISKEFQKRRLENTTIRGKTLASDTTALNRLEKAFGDRKIASITKEELREFFDNAKNTRNGKHLDSQTKKGIFIVFQKLENYAQTENDLVVKVSDSFSSIDRSEMFGRSLDHRGKRARNHTIISVEDAEMLLNGAYRYNCKDLLPALVLELFCGVRAKEITRVEWDAIDLKNKKVVLKFHSTKLGENRIADIPENAMKWLELIPKFKKVTRSNRIDATRDIWKEGKFIVKEKYESHYSKQISSLWKKIKEDNNLSHDLPRNFRKKSYGTYGSEKWGHDYIRRQMGHSTNSTALEEFYFYSHKIGDNDAERYFSIAPITEEALVTV